MARSSPAGREQRTAEAKMDAVMRHHRAMWRVERAGWAIIGLVLLATLFGAFGDGPLSHGHAGSGQALSVDYERLLRASAPAEYRFRAHPSMARDGVLRLRVDNTLVDVMELDSIVPEPDSQTGGPGYTEFAFRVVPERSPASIVVRFRPATFGRHRGEVSVAGTSSLSIDHFVYP